MFHARLRRRGVLTAVALAWIAGMLTGVAHAAETAGDRFYEPGRVLEVRIEMEPADWEQLRRQLPDPGVFSGQPKVNTYT